jgi:hypothetical protein
MTSKRNSSKARSGVKKLKVKKETLKDLEPKGGAVKGGQRYKTASQGCSDACPSVPCLL